MKNVITCMLAILVAGGIANSQEGGLIVKRGTGGLFLEHKVSAKQNFYSIGRLYTVHPKLIAAYNRLDMNKGLAIGQMINVPLTDTNFTQQGNSGTPVYYRAGRNEGLAAISRNFNNVSVQSLRSWNGLPDDNIKAGTPLVIGFLISNELPSVTLGNGTAAEGTKQEPARPVVQETVVKPAVKETAPEPVIREAAPQTEPEKPEPVAVKVETRPAPSQAGFFQSQFEKQNRQSPARRDETVTAGIFKTVAGWEDAKYYMLMDGVQPGTIIRISNPVNNKYVYAKVLGEMSGIRQNKGLNIRLSNAAAAALEIAEQDKFIVKIKY